MMLDDHDSEGDELFDLWMFDQMERDRKNGKKPQGCGCCGVTMIAMALIPFAAYFIGRMFI